ncbi:acyltransferase family protein [uncultured Sphingomonas sp.]|uniref:acyltransferase family protein n=1 Tax=uncultured Sphingomonas sp. TaxID=158754 RepID=UPI0035CB7650
MIAPSLAKLSFGYPANLRSRPSSGRSREEGPDIAFRPREHLAYLDGLRGVAILAVLAVHASQLVASLSQPVRDLAFYGVRGVQLFFIVSGFTLVFAHAGRPLDPFSFAARRFFRIAPMFYAGMVLYLVLSRVTTMPLSTRDATGLDIAATLLFVHGWMPSAINTVVPGGWSIAAEAMFYLVFPAILALVPRPRILIAAVFLSYVVAGLTNIALRKLLGGAAGEALAFPFWLVQLPAFIGGCWLATLPHPVPLARRIAPWSFGLAALGMLVDSQLRESSNLLVAVALLTVFAWSASVVRPRWLQARPLVFLGRISFSFYIVHFAVLGCIRPLVPAMEAAVGGDLAMLTVASLTLAIASCIAAGTFRWIELPIIAATRRVGQRGVPAGA